eukprot:364473-Chlamydomonas_euryale.AAC.1
MRAGRLLRHALLQRATRVAAWMAAPARAAQRQQYAAGSVAALQPPGAAHHGREPHPGARDK